jgi:ElaA protein
MEKSLHKISPTQFVSYTWDQLNKPDLYSLMQLRQAVFVVEQQCPYLDADGLDPFCKHYLGWQESSGSTNLEVDDLAVASLVAAARIVPPLMRFDELSIGRVVNAQSHRGQGLGRQLMQTILAQCDTDGVPAIRISAQRYLERFYNQLGFNPCSDVYDEDGIEHIEMLRLLPNNLSLTDRFGPLEFVPLNASHAALLFQPLSAVAIYQHMEERPQASLETMQARYARLEQGAPSGCGELWLNWLVRDAQTKETLGTIQATVLRNASAEIGYVLSPSAWGRGLGTHCVQWLIKVLQSRYSMQKIIAQVDVRNIASWRAAEKAGMQRFQEVDSVLLGQPTRDYQYLVRT